MLLIFINILHDTDTLSKHFKTQEHARLHKRNKKYV